MKCSRCDGEYEGVHCPKCRSTEGDAIEELHDRIEKAMDSVIAEWDITAAAVIGVLTMVLAQVTADAIGVRMEDDD